MHVRDGLLEAERGAGIARLADACQLSPTYRAAVKRVQREGRRLWVHRNVIVYRIEDLGLRTLIDHRFAGQVVALDEHYVAAPRALGRQIDALARKQGFSARRVA